MAVNHTRTWQFRVNRLNAPSATALATNRTHMIEVVEGFLGRGSWVDKDGAASASAGNWSVWGSCDGAGNFGNNDGVNRWDTTGALDPTKLVWAAAASNHSWIVLKQTGIDTNFSICVDLSNANSYIATVVVAFTGFNSDGTATARPTPISGQTLISNTDWGGINGTSPSILNCAKCTDGKGFRFWSYRSSSCVQFWNFEVPDPVVANFTTPSVAQAVGHSSVTEVVTYSYLSSGANAYSRTPGGTVFGSFIPHDGSQSDNVTPVNQGFPNEVDQTQTMRRCFLYSTTVNGRDLNGELVDAFWGQATGQVMTGTFNGQVLPAGAAQWTRVGHLWLPWVTGEAYNPRIEA